MSCFIMCGQLVLYDMITKVPQRERILMQTNGTHVYSTAIFLYGIWNLDLLRYLVPPFCVNSKLTTIHIIFLGYISAVYPLCLIIFTYLVVELHGHNFRPLVWLWRPFHRCFVRMRRGWDTKSDMVDVFTSFFLLSQGKFMYQSMQLLGCRYIRNMNDLPSRKVTLFDLDAYCFSNRHLPFAIIAIIIILVFVVLPSLVIVLYSTKACRSCLSKCRCNGSIGVMFNTFMEKFHGCYRDGLNGGSDMRIFSGLFLFLRIIVLTQYEMHHLFSIGSPRFFEIILFSSTAYLIALAKPYKKRCHNTVNTLMLALLAFRSLLNYTYTHVHDSLTENYYKRTFAVSILVVTMFPQVIFWTFIILTLVFTTNRLKAMMMKLEHCFKRLRSFTSYKNDEDQPLLDTNAISHSYI